MIDVICPSCQQRHASDPSLEARTVRMRCFACDHVWLFQGPKAEAAVAKRRGWKGALIPSRNPDEPAHLGNPEANIATKRTVIPPPHHASVAARNEDSVLFTVDALRHNAHAPASTPPPASVAPSSVPPPSLEEDGIIDLNALSTAPPSAGARVIAPLFGSEPPGTFAREIHSQPSIISKRQSRLPLIGFAAAAVALLAVALGGASMAFRGEEPSRAAAAAVVVPPPVVVAPTPAAEPPPAATQAAAESKSEDTAAPKAKKGGTKVSSGVRSVTRTSTPATYTPPKAVKPADPCGCHGDFNCILRCAAKGK